MHIRAFLFLLVFSVALSAQMPPDSSATKPVSNDKSTKATTIYLVRHAEKAGSAGDVALSEAGTKRAECLARTLADANLQAVYTTEYKRTKDTGSPAAERSGVTPTVIPGADMNHLVSSLREESGRNILVVGHSNTVPKVIELLGAGTVTIKDEEYDRLFVVTLMDGKASLASLRYCD